MILHYLEIDVRSIEASFLDLRKIVKFMSGTR